MESQNITYKSESEIEELYNMLFLFVLEKIMYELASCEYKTMSAISGACLVQLKIQTLQIRFRSKSPAF